MSTIHDSSGNLQFSEHPSTGYHPKSPKLRWALAIMASGAMILACGLPFGWGQPDQASTAADETGTASVLDQLQETLSHLATQTMQAGEPSETPVPPSPFPSPTDTPVTPTATSTAVPPTDFPAGIAPDLYTKVRFNSGATSAYFQKWIKSGGQHVYHVRALAGQTMILTASSPGDDVTLAVRGLDDGKRLVDATSHVSYWFGTLPKSQVYEITLTTHNPETYYFLSIEIPANIHFKTGAYSGTVEGYIQVHTDFHPEVMTRVRYLAYAFGGQTMTVKLTSTNLEDLSVGIYGQDDGQVYLGYQIKNSGGEVDLPSNQGYYIDVYSTTGKSVSFTLKVTIK